MTAVDFQAGRLVVQTTPFAPYFGDEERKLLASVASLTGIALDRARLFTQEREARTALERADELKTQFVALAAHELRTPVTTIYGFAERLAVAATALERIVSNLLVNASRYGSPPVVVRAGIAAAGLSVVVEDSGPGSRSCYLRPRRAWSEAAGEATGR